MLPESRRFFDPRASSEPYSQSETNLRAMNHPASLETPSKRQRVSAQRENCISHIQSQHQMLRRVPFNHSANIKDKPRLGSLLIIHDEESGVTWTGLGKDAEVLRS